MRGAAAKVTRAEYEDFYYRQGTVPEHLRMARPRRSDDPAPDDPVAVAVPVHRHRRS